MNVVITGGSRGIGAAAVRLFARRGDRVWFLYEKNDAAARAVAAETGALPIRCDVADEVRVTDALSAIPDVDVLINNAGIAHYALINQITPEQWHSHLCRPCGRRVLLHPGGAAVDAGEAARLHHQCVLHVGSGGRELRGCLLGGEGCASGHDEGACAGALARAASASTPWRPASSRRICAPPSRRTCWRICASRRPSNGLGTPEDVAQAMAYLCGRGVRHWSGPARQRRLRHHLRGAVMRSMTGKSPPQRLGSPSGKLAQRLRGACRGPMLSLARSYRFFTAPK